MHLQFYLRGLPEQIGLWKALAQGQFFKWRRINKETKEAEMVLVQGGLRDSVLGTYEYIFPKESLATVLNIMGFTKEKIGVNCFMKDWKGEARLAVLRKIIGLKKIPKKVLKEAANIKSSIVINESERGLSDFAGAMVTVHIIGIKDDPMGDMYDPIAKITRIQELI